MTTPSQFPKLRGGSAEVSRAQDNIGGTLTPIAQALAKTPIMGSQPTWISFPKDAAFTDTSGQPSAYFVDALSMVQTKGSLTTSAGVAANATIGTMPSGCRPKETQRRPVRGNGVTYQSVTIAPTGVVTCDVAIGAGGTIDLGFSFLAEQ